PLEGRERDVLEALLAYGEHAENNAVGHPFSGATPLYVLPRLGTISPWASKATDIARMCALPVHRVERGRLVLLAAGRPLDADEIARVAPLLHDRMTETLLDAPPREETLFGAHSPRPGQHVDLLGAGRAALERANAELGLALA